MVRWYEINNRSLFEAGINISNMDLAAKQVIKANIDEFCKRIIHLFPVELDDEIEDGKISWPELCMEMKVFYHYNENKQQLAYIFNEVFGSRLTNLLQNYLKDLQIQNKSNINVSDYKVDFNALTNTEGVEDIPDGMFDKENSCIFLYLHTEIPNICAFILYHYPNNNDFLIRKLNHFYIKTFIHEYGHLEQHLRNASNKEKDISYGYITTKVKDSEFKGKGRKGINRYELDSGPVSFIKYLGNVKEIDSYASDAASQMMNQITLTSDDQENNRKISELQHKIIQDDEKILYSYRNMINKSRFGDYDDMKIKRKEVEKIWKRFLKLIYQKLEDYKR